MRDLKVLLVDDEESIRNILEFALSAYQNVDCSVATNGDEAIEKLSSSTYDVVVCDYNMPQMNGGDVYLYIVERNIPVHFILCSSESPEKLSEFSDRSKLFGNIVKPDIFEGLENLFPKILDEFQLKELKSKYCAVALDLLLSLQELPAALYLQLSEKRFVKVLHQDDIFEETDYVKYHSKGVHRLYIERSDIAQFQSKIVQAIEDKLNVTETSDVELMQEAQKSIVNIVKSFGVNEASMKAVESYQHKIFEVVGSNKYLKRLFSKITKDLNSYYFQHTFILTFICCSLAEQLKWINDSNRRKIIISSIFHDIYLDEKLCIEESIDPSVSDDFKNHTIKAADLLKSIPNIEQDIYDIVLQHHETADGDGFPNNIPLSKIPTLSSLFSYSHLIVDGLFKFYEHEDFKGKFNEYLMIINAKNTSYAKYHKAFVSLELF